MADKIILAAQLGEKLHQGKLGMLATAESCTGGGIGATLTAISGASDWFDSGFVTYSNEAKIRMLGVNPKTLQTHGAVSEAVALEMAEGAINESQATYSVAVTGIAGPSGGTPEKPVGTVWIAWAMRGKTSAASVFHFKGDREEVREQTIMAALAGLTALVP